MKMLVRAVMSLLVAFSLLAPSAAPAAKEIIYFPPAYTGEQPRHIIVPDSAADALVAAGVAAIPVPVPVRTAAIVTPVVPVTPIGTQIATRSYIMNRQSSYTTATGELKMVLRGSGTTLRAVLPNKFRKEYVSNTDTTSYQDYGTGAPITGTASWEVPFGSGNFYSVTQAGSTALNLADGKNTVTDATTVPAYTSGTVVGFVFNVADTAGLPVTGGTSAGESKPQLTATAVGDTFTANGGATNNAIGVQWGPVAVLAPNAPPSYLALGDSRDHGEGQPVVDGSLAMGMITPSLNSVPWISATTRGDSAYRVGLSNSMSANGLLGELLPYVNFVVVGYGSNDVGLEGRGAAAAETDLTSLYSAITAAGKPIIGTTILPVDSSTNGWVDIANQSVNTGSNGPTSTLNDWMRGLNGTTLAHLADHSDDLTTARNSGIFRVSSGLSTSALVADGIHPNGNGYGVIRQAGSLRTSWITGAYDPANDNGVTFWIDSRNSAKRFSDANGQIISYGGQKVQTLIDRKGNAYFRQASANAPTTVYTNDNMVGFASASSQRLESTDAAAKALMQGTTPSVMVFTATRGTNTNTSTPFSWYNKATGVDFQWDYFDAANNSVGSSRKTSAGQVYASNGGTGGQVPQDTTERVFTRVYDGTNITWYVNGVLIYTGPLSAASLNIDTMALGVIYGGSYNQHLNGLIDQIVGFAGKSTRDASVISAEKFVGALAGISL